MVSRRHFLLRVGAGSALLATAGCLDAGLNESTSSPTESTSPDGSTTPGGTTDDSLPEPLDDAPVRTPADTPAWESAWTMSFDEWRLRDVALAGETLYVTLSRGTTEKTSAIAAVDPTEQSVRWQTETPGGAIRATTGSGDASASWVTVTDDTLLRVTSNVEQNEWATVHALDRESGDPRWSLERERELHVAGVLDDLVVVTGLEFFPGVGTPPATHQTPAEPLSTVVYGVELDSGDVRWTREFEGVDAVDVTPERVYVAAGKRLVGLRSDGEADFQRDTGSVGALDAGEDGVFLLTDLGSEAGAKLRRFTPRGEQVWQRQLPVSELLVDRAAGRLYLGGDSVVAVDVDGGVAWWDDAFGEQLLLGPDGDTLYTRTGVQADAVSAYDVSGSGEKRWTFDPPSRNAWPEAATADRLVASAITAGDADTPFLTVYTVDDTGQATGSRGLEHVVGSVSTPETVYLADAESTLRALRP